MARKAFGVLLPVLAGVLVAVAWPDIRRYLRIERMSFGGGKPQLVPAVGRHTYPSSPGDGTPDGTGEFDSASRGGPAAA